ncbi:protein TolR [Thiohalospira sp.]|uniref:protein TolR n=1 Tax=Thiohalospira sp. TaxID=3080549 RepID=UPI00397EB97D
MARRSKRRPIAEINVVPYIDVMLVLLIIFMITAPMLTQGVQVELPQQTAEPMEDADAEPLVVTVDSQGRLYLDEDGAEGEALGEDELVERAQARLEEAPRSAVMVRGDRATEYGSVVRAMTLLQEAGAESVGLVTREPGDDEQG